MQTLAKAFIVFVALSFVVSVALAATDTTDANGRPPPSRTSSISTTKTRSATRSFSTSLTSSRTRSVSLSSSRSYSPSRTPTRTPSDSPSNTPSGTSTPSDSPSNTPSGTSTPSDSPSITPSGTSTPSDSSSITATVSISPSMSPCPGAARNAILKQKVVKVYTNLIYPTSIQILAGQKNVYDLFANNTKGRVDPVGTFDNFQLLTEYFYALAANPQNRITYIDVLDLFGEGNEVFIKVNVFFSAVNPNNTKPFNLTQSGRYFFNDDDLIEKVDVTIHYLGKNSNPPINRAVYTPQQNNNIFGICYTVLVNPGTCLQVASLDPEGAYANVTDCVTFMNQIPYGTWDDAEANSVVCRQLHTLLTAFDPVTHCPHVGKTGGGKCVDWPYSEYALADY